MKHNYSLRTTFLQILQNLKWSQILQSIEQKLPKILQTPHSLSQREPAQDTKSEESSCSKGEP